MRGTVLPVKEYKELLVLQDIRKLTWTERFKLLMGYNISFEARITTEHKVGRTSQKVKVELTELDKPQPPLIP